MFPNVLYIKGWVSASGDIEGWGNIKELGTHERKWHYWGCVLERPLYDLLYLFLLFSLHETSLAPAPCAPAMMHSHATGPRLQNQATTRWNLWNHELTWTLLFLVGCHCNRKILNRLYGAETLSLQATSWMLPVVNKCTSLWILTKCKKKIYIYTVLTIV